MTSIYGEIDAVWVKNNLSDLINQTFKLLPLRQNMILIGKTRRYSPIAD